MQKCLWAIPLLLLLALPAHAMFETSHHDLRTYDSASSVKEGCKHCHGRIVTATATFEAQDNVGEVGKFCLSRCHALAGIYTGSDPGSLQPGAPSYQDVDGTWVATAPYWKDVMFSRSHGREKGVANTNISTVFPYDTAALPANIECTSCHSVHDDTFSPFIWRPMATKLGSTPEAATATTGLCATCHIAYSGTTGAADKTIGAPSGDHPVDFLLDNSSATGRSSTASAFGTIRHGRIIVIDGGGSTQANTAYGAGNHVFDVFTSSGADLRTAKGTAAWTTGGHMWNNADNNYSNFVNGSSVMGCFTCHSAHRTTGGGSSNLTVLETDNVVDGYNPMCVGCHGVAGTWGLNKNDNNVGMTSYGHPVGSNANDNGTGGAYNTSNNSFSFFVKTNTTNLWAKGNNGEVMCTSCHDVHNGVAGSMAIRDLQQGTNTVICKACHSGVGLANVNDASKGATGEVGNAHHRTRESGVLPAPGGINVAYTAAEETGSTQKLVIAAPSWASGTMAGIGPFKGLGDLSKGMDCADCHVFNGTAHNWNN